MSPRQQWNEIKWKPEVSCFYNIVINNILKWLSKILFSNCAPFYQYLKYCHQIIWALYYSSILVLYVNYLLLWLFLFKRNNWDKVNTQLRPHELWKGIKRLSTAPYAVEHPFEPMFWSFLDCLMSFSCLRCCLTGLRLFAWGESGRNEPGQAAAVVFWA